MSNQSFPDRARAYQLHQAPQTPHASSTGPLGALGVLPGELLNHIYRYVVVSDKPINQWQGVTPRNTPIGHKQPDLARVSKHVREEVLSIFYAENVFALSARIDVAHGTHDLLYFVGNAEHWLDLVNRYLHFFKSVAVADEFRVGLSYQIGCVVGNISEANGQLFVRSINALDGWCKDWSRPRYLGQNTPLALRNNVLMALKCCWSDLNQVYRIARDLRCTRCGLPGAVPETLS